MFITLSELKSHLSIDEDFTADDALLLNIIKAAEDAVALRIDKPLHLCIGIDGYLQPSVKQMTLLLAGTFYNHRESVTSLNVRDLPNGGFEYLAALNKDYKHSF